MKIALVINEGKEKAKQLAGKAVSQLSEKGHKILMLRAEATAIGKPELTAKADDLAVADLVIVLGGDGTILRAARAIKDVKAPFLGVNLGTLGFLSTVEPESIEEAVERFAKQDFFLTRKKKISWKVSKENDLIASGDSLNDITISRHGNQRIIQCDIYVNDQDFLSYAADGIIFASPTGSTAYSLSAGGPLVSPECDVLVMTPVAPHSLFDRSILLSPKDKVKVSLKMEAFISCDGQSVIRNSFDEVEVCLSDNYIDFVEFEYQRFYKALREKLRINEPLQF